MLPFERMSARCSTFSSSRTLPGQSCRLQRPHHVVGNRVDPLPQRDPSFGHQVPHEGGMSSRRWLSVGSVIGKTFSR